MRWRLIGLVQWLHEEFAVSLDETTVGRELKKLGYFKLTARPRHHAQNELALEAFKRGALRPSWQRSKTTLPRRTPIEICFRACPELVSGTKRVSARKTRSRGAGPCASPMPCDAPVMIAILPASLSIKRAPIHRLAEVRHDLIGQHIH